jgi:hypothetical protein
MNAKGGDDSGTQHGHDGMLCIQKGLHHSKEQHGWYAQ